MKFVVSLVDFKIVKRKVLLNPIFTVLNSSKHMILVLSGDKLIQGSGLTRELREITWPWLLQNSSALKHIHLILLYLVVSAQSWTFYILPRSLNTEFLLSASLSSTSFYFRLKLLMFALIVLRKFAHFIIPDSYRIPKPRHWIML